MLMYIYEFLTMTIPRAGFMHNDLPINTSTFLLPIILLININKVLSFIKKWDFSVLYAIFAFFLCFVMTLNWQKNPFFFTAGLVMLASPFAIVIGYYSDPKRFFKILILALILTSGFSIIQYIFGIEKTMIEGITIALGETYEGKPIGILSEIDSAIKMPSTYQNGNGVGVFYVLALPIAMSYNKVSLNKRWRFLKRLSIILGAIGLFLSGSRSCLYPFIFFFVVKCRYILKDLYKAIKNNKGWFILAIATVIVAISVLNKYDFMDRTFERFVTTTSNDSTAAGRTTSFAHYISYINSKGILHTIYYILFGVEWNSGATGDLLDFFRAYGLLFSAAFIACITYPLKKIKNKNDFYVFGLYCALIDFIVDSSYFYPPGLINYFMISGFLLRAYVTDNMQHRKVLNNMHYNNKLLCH